MVSPKEIEKVSQLDAFTRYKYSIKRMVDNEAVFFLQDSSSNYGICEIAQQRMFAVWPSNEYVEMNKIGEWASYIIVEVNLDTFLNQLIPFIRENILLISVFPINEKTGFVVSTDEFVRDINSELTQYE